MRKIPILIILTLLIVSACGGKPESTAVNDTAASAADSTPQVVGENAGARPWTRNIGRYDELFNDSNYIQYASAEKLGIEPIYTLSDAYYTRRPLVKVESGDNYQLDNLTHSMPYLVPEAAELLAEIGRDFGDLVQARGGDPKSNKILVTSLLRSAYSVKRLRRVNRNAVDSSTHMMATTFDIAYNHFYYPDSTAGVDAGVLKGILAEVLLKKREEGRCWVKYEKKTPCFHITVRQP